MPQSNLNKKIEEYTDGGWYGGSPYKQPTNNNNLTDRGYPSSTGGYGNNGYNNKANQPSVADLYRQYGAQESAARKAGYQQMMQNGNTTSTGAVAPVADNGGYYDYGGNDVVMPVGNADYFNNLKNLWGSQASLNNKIYQNNLQNAVSRMQSLGKSANQAYTDALNLLKKNYNISQDRLSANNQNSLDNMNAAAEENYRQAYIQNMLAQKGLGNALANQGLVGGATESTLARMANNYADNRNDIAKQLATNIANQNLNYQNALAELEQNYNNNAASAKQSLNDRLNAIRDQYQTTKAQAQTDRMTNNANAYQNFLQNTINAIQAGDLNSAPIQDAYNAYLKERQAKKKTSKTESKPAEKKFDPTSNKKNYGHVKVETTK